MANMKFKAHQSFFIRKGWLSKGMRAVVNDGSIFMPSSSKAAMDELGLGANQVQSLRYWLQAVGLVVESGSPKRSLLTEFGKIVLENDPYVEEMGTLWALHCNLASNASEATSWYYFFNEAKAKSLSKDDFVGGMQRYISMYSDDDAPGSTKGRAISSIESDFDCILNTYITHEKLSGKPASPENVIDCPLGDLGVLDIDNRSLKTYRKKPANLATLPGMIVLYAISRKIEIERELDGKWLDSTEISLEELLSGRFSPGRLFNLDSVALLSKLYELENDGCIRLNRTAGSDVVRVNDDFINSNRCLMNYYSELSL